MKKSSYSLTIPLFLVALLLTSLIIGGGCSKGGSPANDINAQNIADRAQSALQNVKSYELDMEMTMHVMGTMNGEQGDVTISVKSNGAMDMVAKKSGIEMAMNAKGKAGSDTVNEATKLETYIINDIAYVGTSDKNGKMSWQHQAAPVSVWDQQNQITQQMSLLKSSSIKYLKTEKVQGAQCYLVELDPNLDILWNSIGSQLGQLDSGLDASMIKQGMKKVTAKYWFTEDALFFKKTYVYMEMGLNEKQMGGTGNGQMNFTVEMTVDFSKYNESVNIQLPAEAKTN